MAIAIALALALAGAMALAFSNKSRADRWEDRAFTLERNTEQLNGLLIERSTQLNERTRELNQLAAKVERQQSALTRSESDVASLTRRQRALAAEKAEVEDSRAALQLQSRALNSVATAFVACKDGLVSLLGYVVEGDSGLRQRRRRLGRRGLQPRREPAARLPLAVRLNDARLPRSRSLLAVVLAGCGAQAAAPPDEDPEMTVPRIEPVSDEVPEAVRVKIPRLASQSATRRARKLTVRVRNVSCQGVGIGSGFAIERNVLVTNRHVLAGADEIEVSTWDGRTLEATAAEVGVLGDLGIAHVQGKLPLVGSYGGAPEKGDAIRVVGYPGGGELTLAPGSVVDLVDGSRFGIPGRIMRLTARVVPGQLGRPGARPARARSRASCTRSRSRPASGWRSPSTRSAASSAKAASRTSLPAAAARGRRAPTPSRNGSRSWQMRRPPSISSGPRHGTQPASMSRSRAASKSSTAR